MQKTLADLKAKYASRLGIFLNSSSASSGRPVSAASYENIARSILAASAGQKDQSTLRAYLHPVGSSPSRTQRLSNAQHTVGRQVANSVQQHDAPIAAQAQPSAVHVTYRAHQSEKPPQREQVKSPAVIQSRSSTAVQYQDASADGNVGRLQLPVAPSAFPSMQSRGIEFSVAPPPAAPVSSHAPVDSYQQQQQQISYPQNYQRVHRSEEVWYWIAIFSVFL